ncbi:hypothetical protein NU195Hw_g5861t1 [Hortaea werneckii]
MPFRHIPRRLPVFQGRRTLHERPLYKNEGCEHLTNGSPISAACEPTLLFEALIQHPLFIFIDNTDLNIITELTYRTFHTNLFTSNNNLTNCLDINTTLPTHQPPFKPSKRHSISSSDLK